MRRRPSGRGGLTALASFDGKGRMNSVERLVHMANQIATNLATDDDPVAATADHIDKFWDPRMKAMILANREGLSEVAAQAVARLG
jgi:formate dehydrogenase subunit delta